MNDLQKKVVKGLIELHDVAVCDHRMVNGYPTADLCFDALSLLNEQEARLLTLEEVKNLSINTDVWIQHAHKWEDDIIGAATVSETDNLWISFWYGTALYYRSYGKKSYGWFCWTSRPTKEQQEKVKWND